MDQRNERRLMDLEIRVTHHEDLIQELNKLVVKQQQHIDRLLAQSRLLGARVRELSEELPAAGSGDERPPHY